MTAKFMHAPLGVDAAVFKPAGYEQRPIGVVTSGFVSGMLGEAIEEVAEAALAADLSVFHLGPRIIVGMQPRREVSWWNEMGIPDSRLADVYAQARWVSGLRHVEGFELPAAEGLLCGARPIVFDRPEMRRWFDGHAVFIPECSGKDLVRRLARLFTVEPQPVSEDEHREAVKRFAWDKLARQFWGAALEGSR